MCITRVALLTLLAATPAMTSQSDDTVAQLVGTVVHKQKDRPFWFHLRSIGFGKVPYVFDVTTRVVKYDGDGKPKAKDSGCVTRGVFIPIEGQMFYTPLEGCGGTPVDPKTRESFEERNRERLDKVKRRSEAEKSKIRAEEQKTRKERALFWDEFMKAFHFRIIERRTFNDRATTRISFTPDARYRPGAAVDTKYLPKIQGQIWVDDADNEISHFEMEFINDVSSGFGVLGKVSAGTSYFMDLAKAIEDQWMPTKAETVIKTRSLLVMKTNEKYTAEYGNYRKFTTDVLIRVVGPEN